jgi:hypothetical protein
MLELSKKWAKVVCSQPETGMGYQVVTVSLEDGRQFERVLVVGGRVVSVDGDASIPFGEPDIDDIVVTHGKK